jgi:hypothetical protein
MCVHKACSARTTATSANALARSILGITINVQLSAANRIANLNDNNEQHSETISTEVHDCKRTRRDHRRNKQQHQQQQQTVRKQPSADLQLGFRRER